MRKLETQGGGRRALATDLRMSAVQRVKLLSTCHLPRWRALCTNVVVGHSRSYRRRPAMLTPSSATVAMRNLTVARFIVDSSINADAHGSALIFASDRQLQSATSVFFDATFKVVPHIYYQLFTIIVLATPFQRCTLISCLAKLNL